MPNVSAGPSQGGCPVELLPSPLRITVLGTGLSPVTQLHHPASHTGLSAMRRKAVDEKTAAVQTAKTMKAIEEEAGAQFARDQAEAAAHRASSLGEWVLNQETGHHYNAQHQWYYDTGSKMYYGGEPPAWTASPTTLPHAAHFEVMYPPLTRPRPTPGQSPPTNAAASERGAGSRTAAHPLSGLGGYAMPSVGRIGGAKGVGRVEDQAADAQVSVGVRVEDEGRQPEVGATWPQTTRLQQGPSKAFPQSFFAHPIEETC